MSTPTSYIIHGAQVLVGTESLGEMPWGVNLSTTKSGSAETKEYPGPSGCTETVVIYNAKKELSIELLATKGSDGLLKAPPAAGDIVEVDGIKYVALADAEEKYATGEAVKYTLKLTHFPNVNLQNIS